MPWVDLANVASVPFVSYVLAALVIVGFQWLVGWPDDDAVRAFLFLEVGLLGWSLTYAMRILVTDLGVLTVLTQLVFIWVSLVTLSWLLFALYYTGRGAWVTRRRLAAVVCVHVLLVAVVMTNPIHHQFFSSAAIEVVAGIRTASLPFGPLGWAVSIAEYVFMFAGSVLLAVFALRSNRLYRWQTTALLVGVVIPVGTTVVHLLDLHPWGFDPSPIAFAVATVPIGVAVVKFRFTRLLPVAQATVVRTLSDGVIVVDDAGTVVDTNDAARTFLERTTGATECVGRVASDVLPAEFVEARLDAGGDQDGVECAVTVGGEKRWYWLRTLPIEDGPGGHVLTFADVTAQKRYEHELERQNERLEEFAGVVSHDLRNPIGVVDGQAALLREDVESPAARERVDTIRAATDRMTELVDDVLTLAREGRPIESTDACSIGAVAERAWEHVDTGDADLTVQSDDWEVVADESRLTQLFENLFRNAIEHAGADVTVTVGRLDDPDEGFFVADDGPGIPESEREKVLQPGYTTSDSGTGFGLGIVAEIAEAHGWSVTITDSDAARDLASNGGTAPGAGAATDERAAPECGARFEFRTDDAVGT